MSAHAWYRPILAAPMGKPPVRGWVACSRCGVQLCATPKGQQVFARSASDREWVQVPALDALVCRPAEPPEAAT